MNGSSENTPVSTEVPQKQPGLLIIVRTGEEKISYEDPRKFKMRVKVSQYEEKSHHSACLLKRVLVKLAADSLDGQRKDLLIRCFNMIDSNDDGLISVKELSLYLQRHLKFEASIAQDSAAEIVREIGSKNETNITFSGFREGAISFDLGQKDQIQKTFQNISDGNEYVVVADLDKYFRHRVENKSLTQMLKEIDKDRDDKISFEEFCNAMQSPLRAAHLIRNPKMI